MVIAITILFEAKIFNRNSFKILTFSELFNVKRDELSWISNHFLTAKLFKNDNNETNFLIINEMRINF